ncbi:MAG TPA: carbohydrate-binding family 9-like protein [Pyrinomonadaceae bacterium]
MNKNSRHPNCLSIELIKQRLLPLLGLLCLLTVGIHGQELPRPTYEVAHTRVPIKVDGRLDEAAWKMVPTVGNFVNNADGSHSQLKTEARLLYDEKFLYFAFRCVDDNIWATYKRRDEHLWLEEVVEFFVQADEHKPSYIEVEVNPLGTLLDLYMLDVRKPLHYESWNSEKLQWAVQVVGTVDGRAGDKEWTCEIALPMEDVVTAPHLPPQPGDHWRLNLYRVEQRPAASELAWSPTLQNDFHVPRKFGEIVFTARQVP